jgi:hypothetical protein
MTKKSFKTSFDSLLLGEVESKTKKNHTSIKEIRATFIVKEPHIQKLKAISYWERKLIKIIIDEALANYIDLYEKKNGAIQLPK